MKKLLLIAALFIGAALCHADNISIPSPELQTRLAAIGITFVPRTLKETPGYWHFSVAFGEDAYVPEGSTYEQIQALFLAKAKALMTATPTPNPYQETHPSPWKYPTP